MCIRDTLDKPASVHHYTSRGFFGNGGNPTKYGRQITTRSLAGQTDHERNWDFGAALQEDRYAGAFCQPIEHPNLVQHQIGMPFGDTPAVT
jgi:hypothetical protein